MSYKMFLDDVRYPPDASWILAKNSEEAAEIVEILGVPKFISFDHDLGGNDTAMVFLKWLISNYHDRDFEYAIHSANPIGSKNIESYIESWKKSKL